jgi:LEA14-like dessication related protein
MSELMSRREWLGLVIAAGLPVGGCAKIGEIPGLDVLKQFLPKVTFDRLAVKDVDFTRISTDFVFNVSNPNPIEVKLASFSYALDLAGHRFLDGDQKDGLQLKARGDSKLVFPLATTFQEIIALAGDLRGKDDVPFAFSGRIGFNTPLGEVKVPFQTDGRFPVLKVPKIRFKALKLGRVNLLDQSATLELQLGVAHQQGSKLDFSAFDYALTLGGRQVLDGVITKLASVEPGEEATVSLPLTIRLVQVGATIFEAITKKEKVSVGLDANLDVATPFGVIPLHIDETGKLQLQ